MAEGFMNQAVLDGTAQCGSPDDQAIQGKIPHLGEAEFCRRVHSGSSRRNFCDEGCPDPGWARGL